MNKYIIYRHTSPEGLHYIGYTSQSLNQRSGSKGKHYQHNERFWNDIQRFGWDKFEHVILETCETLENAMQLEIKYISEYDSTNALKGYNRSIGGYPSNKGLTEEEKRKRRYEATNRWKCNNRERHLENQRRYCSTPEYKAKKNEYNKTERRRKHRTEYMRKYRETHRERIREIQRKAEEKRKGKADNEDCS